MATSFEQRAAQAVSNPKFRISDFPGLIDEGKQLVDDLQATVDSAGIEACDFTLGEEDREEAAALHGKSLRRMVTVRSAVEALDAKLAERKAAETASKSEQERQAAIAERDEIAERFRAIVPQAVEALTKLFAEVEANEQRLIKAKAKTVDAELSARGLKSYFGGAPIERFAKMKIPNFAGPGRAWPKVPARQEWDIIASQRRIKEHSEKQDAERLAARGMYRLFPVAGQVIAFRAAATPAMPLYERGWKLSHMIWTGVIAHAEVERLRGLGVTAHPVEEKVQ